MKTKNQIQPTAGVAFAAEDAVTQPGATPQRSPSAAKPKRMEFGQMPTLTKKTRMETTSCEAVNPSLDMNVRDQIEKRAHEIWLSSGRSHGNDVAHWLQAEIEVVGRAPKRTQIRPSGPQRTLQE
jgi:hypothetical protein